MKIFTGNDEIAVEIDWIGRKSSNLTIWGKVLGTMAMEMYITPEELCKGLKIVLNWRVLSYVLLLPYFIIKLILGKLINNIKVKIK